MNLLEEVRLEVLSELWGAALIEAWRHDWPVYVAAKRMALDNGGTLESFGDQGVHNWPLPSCYPGSRRYIAAFLPKTNTALWDGLSPEKVLEVFLKEKQLSRSCDVRKEKHDHSDRMRSKNEYHADRLGVARELTRKDQFTRSGQWTTVK